MINSPFPPKKGGKRVNRDRLKGGREGKRKKERTKGNFRRKGGGGKNMDIPLLGI